MRVTVLPYAMAAYEPRDEKEQIFVPCLIARYLSFALLDDLIHCSGCIPGPPLPPEDKLGLYKRLHQF
jgi:hypothetical protein